MIYSELIGLVGMAYASTKSNNSYKPNIKFILIFKDLCKKIKHSNNKIIYLNLYMPYINHLTHSQSHLCIHNVLNNNIENIHNLSKKIKIQTENMINIFMTMKSFCFVYEFKRYNGMFISINGRVIELSVSQREEYLKKQNEILIKYIIEDKYFIEMILLINKKPMDIIKEILFSNIYYFSFINEQ